MNKNILIIILALLLVISTLPAKQQKGQSGVQYKTPQQNYWGIPLLPNIESGKKLNWRERRKQAEEWLQNQTNVRQQHLATLQNLQNQMEADGQIDVEDFNKFIKYSIDSQRRLLNDMDMLYTEIELLKAYINDVSIQVTGVSNQISQLQY